MKKHFPYIIIGLVTVAVIVLFFTTDSGSSQQFDDRVTLQKRDKIPYGTYVAFESLKELFPLASVGANRQEPGYWDSLSNYDSGQALIVVTKHFNASDDEMKRLVRFIENGNDVFISTMNLSYEASQLLKCDVNTEDALMYYFDQTEGSDLLSVSLTRPPFREQAPYSYPGKRYDFYFYKLDTATATVLGYDKNRKPNFIHLKAGLGNLYIHLAPMTFTNYFLLHKNNITYYENMLSVISPNTSRIIWDEYFNSRRQRQAKRSNWINAFLDHPSLKWALLTALVALLVYVLMEMRRKQRIIPVISKPKNDSMEFVKTIGRLYHDKGDHKNLCKKMSAYFLEYVRSRYKLPTSELDEAFEKSLQVKSGAKREEIEAITSFTRQLDMQEDVTDKQLAWFHKQLENFYKHS